MPDPFSPIGLFDSGFGGLTVLKALLKFLPYESFVYFADNLHAPFGEKSTKEIIFYAEEAARFLMQQKIKLLVVACNTSSSLALEGLQKKLPIPVVGVVGPTLEKLKLLKVRRLGVVATLATVSSEVYPKGLSATAKGLKIVQQACPKLVPLIERGETDSSALREALKKYLAPLKKEKLDYLLLGCTHYPLIKKLFQKYLGKKVKIVDSSSTCLCEVRKRLLSRGLLAPLGNAPAVKFFVSKEPQLFQKIGEGILGKKIEKVLIKDENLECR
ncbi:MAG: glutamate racemase [Parachlamydiales bacterium]|jgi:glutamate racemase